MDQILNEFRKYVKEQVEFYSGMLISGDSITSIEKYREIVGRIAGLVESLQMLDLAISNVNKSTGVT